MNPSEVLLKQLILLRGKKNSYEIIENELMHLIWSSTGKINFDTLQSDGIEQIVFCLDTEMYASATEKILELASILI
jgi:hypothetical protein